MTRRERMECRAERRLDWAESRDRMAGAALGRSHAATGQIPLGQPILAGHHSAKRHRRAIERGHKAMRAAVESAGMARHHREKAANIQTQLDRSIFSDDADAVAQLEARIAEREAERDRLKAYNASCRKAAKEGGQFGDLSLLDERQRMDLRTIARVASFQLREGGAFPAYALSNLAGRIKADRDRLAALRRVDPVAPQCPNGCGQLARVHPEPRELCLPQWMCRCGYAAEIREDAYLMEMRRRLTPPGLDGVL